MAWPNPFRRRDENTRTCWQYTFQLTPDHFTAEQSGPMKFSYDVLGEECLNVLNDLFPQPTYSKPAESAVDEKALGDGDTKNQDPAQKAKRDLYVLLRDNFDKHE